MIRTGINASSVVAGLLLLKGDIEPFLAAMAPVANGRVCSIVGSNGTPVGSVERELVDLTHVEMHRVLL
ncbi:hypothetical protein [Bremerella alba]|uniref:Uncharacterized protein n=1 Tax=Bremerella alba TaxID=980252 RepID=A0A7V8V9M7_9BACT|nr:hypothetical protein [Bremerella alba]MBA2117436.1 hypothetical protein [Bremerella alba]